MSDVGSVASNAGGSPAPSLGAETTAPPPASATPGPTPGGGGDAAQPDAASVAAATSAAEKFRFLGREFDDSKKAEEAFGAEINQKRATQRENATLKKTLEGLQQEVATLRAFIGPNGRQPAPGSNGDQAPIAFADDLAKSGELELFAQIAQDPNMGPGHMAYAMAQAFDKHYSSKLDAMREEIRGELGSRDARGAYEASLARTMTAATKLSSEFPELDPKNESEEAEAAQTAVLEHLQSTPQVEVLIGGRPQMVPQGVLWLKNAPADALRWAASEVRRQRGVPVFAHPPGTSGSPSARIAAASERAAAATAGEPIDGNGTPRPRPGGGKPKTLAEEWRQDKETRRREVATPGGRTLGFHET